MANVKAHHALPVCTYKLIRINAQVVHYSPEEEAGEREYSPQGSPSPHPGDQDPVVMAVGDERAGLPVTDVRRPPALDCLCFTMQYLLLAKTPGVFALHLLQSS